MKSKIVAIALAAVTAAASCQALQGSVRDDPTGQTNARDATQVLSAVTCAGGSILTMANHGYWCGPGNCYWTGDRCNPNGGVQLLGPVADPADQCCMNHDLCFEDVSKTLPACNCAGLPSLWGPPSPSTYTATCQDAGVLACSNPQPGDTVEVQQCRTACCNCDSVFSQCLSGSLRQDGGLTDATRGTVQPDGSIQSNCPPAGGSNGSTGQSCSSDPDCTFNPGWPTPDGGAPAFTCFEGWCFVSCTDGNACLPGQTCGSGGQCTGTPDPAPCPDAGADAGAADAATVDAATAAAVSKTSTLSN